MWACVCERMLFILDGMPEHVYIYACLLFIFITMQFVRICAYIFSVYVPRICMSPSKPNCRYWHEPPPAAVTSPPATPQRSQTDKCWPICQSHYEILISLHFAYFAFCLSAGHSYKSINDEIILVSIIMGITILVLITIALCYIAYEKCHKKREYFINA